MSAKYYTCHECIERTDERNDDGRRVKCSRWPDSFAAGKNQQFAKSIQPCITKSVGIYFKYSSISWIFWRVSKRIVIVLGVGNMYRFVQKKSPDLLSISQAQPGRTFSQLRNLSFAQPCTHHHVRYVMCLILSITNISQTSRTFICFTVRVLI